MRRRSGNGMMLSAGRLFAMSLAFRFGSRLTTPGFGPGLRHILAYEARRLWHRMYERERIAYHVARFALPWLRRRG